MMRVLNRSTNPHANRNAPTDPPGNRNATPVQTPDRTSPVHGPAREARTRRRGEAIHTSVVSTKATGIPKYSIMPALGTERPACLTASPCPTSWMARVTASRAARTRNPVM